MENEIKDKLIKFRVSVSQKREIEKAAQAEGMSFTQFFLTLYKNHVNSQKSGGIPAAAGA